MDIPTLMTGYGAMELASRHTEDPKALTREATALCAHKGELRPRHWRDVYTRGTRAELAPSLLDHALIALPANQCAAALHAAGRIRCRGR